MLRSTTMSTLTLAPLFALLAASQVQASCGSAFCTLNTNWSTQGVWTEPGARVDLRYEYFNQDELYSGSDKASREEAESAHHREVETINRNLLLNADYTFNETFGVSVNLPLVMREHTHLHLNHTDHVTLDPSSWDFTRLGDIRVLGRMQLSSDTSVNQAYGLNLGVKLPTGSHEIANDQGKIAERSMQPGTGTTDAILGGYYRYNMPQYNSQWFTQLLVTRAFDEVDGYEPGQQLSLDLGYRYRINHMFSLLAQLNYQVKQRDSGEEAEPEDSGSKSVFFSPGVSAAFGHSTQVYAFVHHRLHQDVNGLQLTGANGFVAGVSTRF